MVQQRRTRKDILASEAEASSDVAESIKDQVMEFMTRPSSQVAKFLITLRKDGRPHSRPVAAFVEGWTIGTISQGEHLKNTHIRNNPIVGYQFVELHPEPGKPLKSVWVQGTCEVISDKATLDDFYARRTAAINMPDGHPDEDWERLLLKTTPTLVRAEGFLEFNKPAIYRFDKAA
jgi:general stress protein 26